jgi:hypothetical protein
LINNVIDGEDVSFKLSKLNNNFTAAGRGKFLIIKLDQERCYGEGVRF